MTIIGAGLLGTSLLQAAHARKVCKRTVAWSRRAESRESCREALWCDSAPDALSDAVAGADLIIISTPVDNIAEMCKAISSSAANALITDVGSVKTSICHDCHDYISSPSVFIGSHPMAGSEKTGMEHASPELFRGHPCFVTPMDGVNEDAIKRLTSFWEALGMSTTRTSPEEHDAIVARISHLPHFIASVLCEQFAKLPEGESALSGAGLKDTTRIAAGDAGLWAAILKQNRSHLIPALDEFEKAFREFRSALDNDDPSAIHKLLIKAQEFRKSLKSE